MIRSHPFTTEEVKQRLEPLREYVHNQLRIDTKWDGDNLSFSGRGASGQIILTDGKVDVVIVLGLMLAPFKSKLKGKITQGLDDAIRNA